MKDNIKYANSENVLFFVSRKKKDFWPYAWNY